MESNNTLSNLSNTEDLIQETESTSNGSKLPVLIWDEKVPNTQLEKFKTTMEKKYGEKFESYWDLHKWSIEHFEKFWEEVWILLDIVCSKSYDEVYRKTGEGFLDCEWFPGARFNFAENILRIRDDSVALICADENDYEEFVTFAEMFEEVKLYAAAFKKNDLKKGDRVSCLMSNRKEAIFAFLAAVSIGAIFGGPHPFLGSRAATYFIQKMDPKISNCNRSSFSIRERVSQH